MNETAQKLALAAEFAYIGVLLWVIFPRWHEPVLKYVRLWRYYYRMGELEQRAKRMEPWQREALEVRGRIIKEHAGVSVPNVYFQ